MAFDLRAVPHGTGSGWWESERDVIVRVLTATVPIGRATALHDLLRDQLPLMRAHDGLVYVKLARRLDGPIEEVVLFEEWRDPKAMYAWTGPLLDRARLPAGSEDLIEELRITHYESLDVDAAAFEDEGGDPRDSVEEAVGP